VNSEITHPAGPGTAPGRWQEVAALLGAARRVAIATHIHPDGDAVGSQMALMRLLRARGCDAVPVLAEPVPDNFAFLDPGNDIRVAGDPRTDQILAQAECIAIVDVSRSDRLGRLMNPVLASGARRVCIDHHAEGDFPAHAQLIDLEVSSTGELVYELARLWLGPAPLPLDIALPLYVAVMTDTGGFRFGNTTPSAHRIAADLLASGVQPPEVHREVFERVKPETLRLLGLSLNSLQVDLGGRLAWIEVTQEFLARSGARQEDVDGFVDLPRNLGTAVLVILFMQLASGKLKVSLRSREPVDVRALASSFGGGGHPQASGILMAGPWEPARDRVLEAARALLNGARP
jgi:phosphoesterase RecJ-like protein